MPTQLDNTWLPGEEAPINTDFLGGYNHTSQVSKEVRAILEHIGSRKFLMQMSVNILLLLKDSRSDLTSDDLLWYIRGMNLSQYGELNSIKIKDTNLVLPHHLAKEIIETLKNL